MKLTDDRLPGKTAPSGVEGTGSSGDRVSTEPQAGSVGADEAPISESAEKARHDLLLLRRASGGDASAFEELMERHAKSMYRLAYMLIGSAADAEDVLQETWTGVYKAMKRFEGRSSVRTWLTRILTTQVALWRRKRKGGVISLDDSAQAQADELPGKQHSATRNADWQSDLSIALTKLSGDHREVIVLREIEGLSYDEIADSLKVPRGTVESRLHRARGELRKLLQAYVP